MANDLVVKSNTLINASYSLTLAEQRLIGLAIVKANNQHKEVDPNTMLIVTALEYMEQFNVDRATAYEALKKHPNAYSLDILLMMFTQENMGKSTI